MRGLRWTLHDAEAAVAVAATAETAAMAAIGIG